MQNTQPVFYKIEICVNLCNLWTIIKGTHGHAFI